MYSMPSAVALRAVGVEAQLAGLLALRHQLKRGYGEPERLPSNLPPEPKDP